MQSVYFVRRKDTRRCVEPKHVEGLHPRTYLLRLTTWRKHTTWKMPVQRMTQPTLRDHASNPIRLKVSLNNVPVDMELDTEASLSVLNQNTYKFLHDQGKISHLNSPGVQLRTYTGQTIRVLGTAEVEVKFMGKVSEASIQVVSGDGPNLMGRDWLSKLGVKLGEVLPVHQVELDTLTPLQTYKPFWLSILRCLKMS